MIIRVTKDNVSDVYGMISLLTKQIKEYLRKNKPQAEVHYTTLSKKLWVTTYGFRITQCYLEASDILALEEDLNLSFPIMIK